MNRTLNSKVGVGNAAAKMKFINPRQGFYARSGAEPSRKRRKIRISVPPTRILELATLDILTPNLVVTSPATKRVLGPPLIGVAGDEKSKMVIGTHIGINSSVLTALRCVENAIMPKNFLRDEYPEIQNSWDAYGIPETLVVNDGIEFHGGKFRAMIEDLGIVIRYSTAGSRTLDSLRYFFHHLSQRLIYSKNRVLVAGVPTIGLDELGAITHAAIIDSYNQAVHRDIDDVPALVWQREIKQWPPRLPTGTELNAIHEILQLTDGGSVANQIKRTLPRPKKDIIIGCDAA